MLKRNFGWSTLVTASLLLGFAGFGLGVNYQSINERLLQSPSQQLPADLDYTSIEKLYDTLRTKYGGGQLDVNKLVEGAQRGLVAASGDAYTTFLNEADTKEFREELNGTFSGIGAEIAIKNERLVVVAPLAGSPAKAAGLLAGDLITGINGDSTESMSTEAAVAKIRGKAGTNVKLTIVHGQQSARNVTIRRAVINIPSVDSSLKPGGVGYIKLNRFDETTHSKLQSAAADLKSQGASKFILDLRDNPGGLLNQAADITDEFLGNNKVIVTEKKDGEVIDSFRSTAGGVLEGVKTIVLINDGSASASEIVAGALKDHGAATLVGTKSFGKGSVQELVDVGGQNFLKVTVALWYTPSGHNISKEGIEPDVKVRFSKADFNKDRDPQLARALKLLQE